LRLFETLTIEIHGVEIHGGIRCVSLQSSQVARIKMENLACLGVPHRERLVLLTDAETTR
jgi:hypothetical protein